MKKIENKKSLWFGIALYLIFFIFQIIVISNKENYFVDETLSYGLANYTKGYFLVLDEGYKYEPAAQPFIEYLSCQPGNRSNFQIAWSNQTNDSHPPFYYALVHLVCALKVGTFSKWYAGSINIVFSLMTLFVIRRIAKLLTGNDTIKNLVSVGFILSYGILSDCALFRMYFMSMFLVALTTYLVLLQHKKDMGILFYILMIVVVSTGALTHYYCLLYDIFLSVVYCLYLLFHKKWKETVYYCISMAIAAAITIGIFPPIVRHLFSTGHAQDAFSGITAISNYFSRILLCFNTINEILFGRMLYVIIPAIVIMKVLLSKRETEKKKDYDYLFALLPGILCFVTVAITATYTNERYFTPVFAILYCAIMSLFLSLLGQLFNDDKRAMVVEALIVLTCTGLSYVGAQWPYLYKEDLAYLKNAEQYKDSDCICIHNEYRLNWEVQLNFNEFIKYKSFTILDQRLIETEDIKEYVGDSKNVVINLTCIDNKEEYINEIIKTLPQFTSYDEIGGNGNGVSYHLR